jgi:glucose uptake protein
MFIIQDYTIAVIFCLVTMLCWGSWANTQKLAASSWRFELFYWDYVIGIFLMAFLFALTRGSSGENGRSFLTDLGQASSANIVSALVGGVVFNAANILLGAAISIAGMSVAFPVGIGLALVLGVLVNYADNPVGNPVILFLGVGLVVAAILLNAFAYRRTAANSQGVSGKRSHPFSSSRNINGLLLPLCSCFHVHRFYQARAWKTKSIYCGVLLFCGYFAQQLAF